MTIRYAMIENGAVTATRDFDIAPTEIRLVDGLPVLRPITSVVDPPFDPATQVRTGPTYTIADSEVTEVFAVRAKTPAELDSDDGLTVDELPARLLFEVFFNLDNRVRALEGLAPKTRPELRDQLIQIWRNLEGR